MPVSKSKNILYRLALPFLSPSVSSDPVADIKGHSLASRESLVSIIRKNHVTGSAVMLSSGDMEGSVFTRAFHTEKIPDEKTFFRVASITKMATALLSVKLMDLGILDPDAPVAELLPDGRKQNELKGILFRHLLSHTSGLADPPNLIHMLNQNKPYSEAISGANMRAPGSSFLYSNLAYGLIGSIVETQLGISVEHAFREYCFIPLEMNATLDASTLSANQIMPLVRVLPYRPGKTICKPSPARHSIESPDPEYHYGYTAGSLYTDIISLKKMTSCIRDGGTPLVSAAYADYMKKETAQYGSVSPTLSYGSGLLIIRDKRISRHAVYGHQGFAYGCVDGAFWEDSTGNIIISLNGGASEARCGRLGLLNYELCRWAFGEELPEWKQSKI